MSSIDELTIALSIDQSTEFKELLKLLKTFKREAGEAVRTGADIGIDIGAMTDLKESLDWIQTKLELILPANLERKVVPSAAGALARNIEIAGFRETGKEFFKKISDIGVIKERLGLAEADDEEVLDAMEDLIGEMVDHLKWIEKYNLTGPQAAAFVNAVNQIYAGKQSLRGRGIFMPIFKLMGEQQAELRAWARTLPETLWAKEFQYKTLTPAEVKERELWTADTAKKLAEHETPELKKQWEESFDAPGGELSRLREYLGEDLFWRLKKEEDLTKEERKTVEYFMLRQLQRQTEESLEKLEQAPFFERMFKGLGKLIEKTQTEVFGKQKEESFDLVIEKTDAVMEELQRVGLTVEELERDFGKIIAIEQSIYRLSKSAMKRYPKTLEHVVTVSKLVLDLVEELRDTALKPRLFHQANINKITENIRKQRLTEPKEKIEEKKIPLPEPPEKRILGPKDITLVRKAPRLPELLLKEIEERIKTLTGLTQDNAKKTDLVSMLDTLKNLLETYKKEESGF